MASIAANEDYYEVLQIASNASASIIKASYYRLAQLRHPDKNAGKPEATALFQLLQSAYETLSDPIKRAEYDGSWSRKTTESGPTFGTKHTPYNHTTCRPQHDAREDFGFESSFKYFQSRNEVQIQWEYLNLLNRRSNIQRDISQLSLEMSKLQVGIKQAREEDNVSLPPRQIARSTNSSFREAEHTQSRKLCTSLINEHLLWEKEQRLHHLTRALDTVQRKIREEEQARKVAKKREKDLKNTQKKTAMVPNNHEAKGQDHSDRHWEYRQRREFFRAETQSGHEESSFQAAHQQKSNQYSSTRASAKGSRNNQADTGQK